MALTAQAVYGFTREILLSNFDDPQKTPDFHYEMWEDACSPQRYIAWAAPRGHAKSTAITHSYSLAALCFREFQYILLVSDTEGQAIQFLYDIKVELLENDRLRSLFKVKRLIKDTETEIVVEFTDGYQAKVSAKGALQKLRGMKWRGKRPQLIIGDDLENDEIVMNDDRRAKFRAWFFNALVPCLSKNGKIRVVGTILHFDSLLMRWMPDVADAETVNTPLKMYSTKKTAWKATLYRAHPSLDDFSEILWPEQFNEARLKEIRQGYIDQSFSEGYSQEYLNYPLDETNNYIRKQDLRPLDTTDKQYEEFYVAADLAISQKDQRAWSVIVVGGRSASGVIKIRDVRRFRGDSYTIIDEIVSVIQRYKPVLFGIEKENIARAIGPFLQHKLVEMNLPNDCLLELPPIHDKIQRGRTFQSLTRAGLIEFDTEAEWWPKLFNEIIQFPRGVYSDQFDALAWLCYMIQHMTDAPTYEHLQDAARQEEYIETFQDFNPNVDPTFGNYYQGRGRNRITGY